MEEDNDEIFKENFDFEIHKIILLKVLIQDIFIYLLGSAENEKRRPRVVAIFPEIVPLLILFEGNFFFGVEVNGLDILLGLV